MNIAQISTQADALAAQFPGVSREQLIEISAEVTASQPKARKPYARKVVPMGSRCCARVWGTGSGKDQCSKSQMDGSDFCKAHAAKHAENPCPCQLDESGKRIGLFCGDIRERLVGTHTDGSWVITWNDDELQAQMATEKDAHTFKFHPWAPNSGELARSKKKVLGGGASAKPKVTKPKVTKAKADKPKRGKTAYFCFLGENRSAIKTELQAGDASKKIAQSAIVKEAALRWKEMGEEARTPYAEMSKRDKAEKIAAWEAEHGSDDGGASCTTLTLAPGWEHAVPQGAWGLQRKDLDGLTLAPGWNHAAYSTVPRVALGTNEMAAAHSLATLGMAEEEIDFGSSSEEDEEDSMNQVD
jgi:hypothetical protein